MATVQSMSSSSSKGNFQSTAAGTFSKMSSIASNNLTSSNTSNINNTANWSVSSTYTSPSIGTVGIGSNNYGYLYTDILDTSKFTDLTLRSLLSCLPESKIAEVLDIARENMSDDDTFKAIVRSIVSCRHYSEEFLLKYIDYLDKDTLFIQHKENILSREYHSLALLLEERDSD